MTLDSKSVVKSRARSRPTDVVRLRNTIPLSAPLFSQSFLNRALLANHFVSFNLLQNTVESFEIALQQKTGFAFAVATNSCTAALHLAFRIIGVRSGDEVWCPTLTYIASIGPAVLLGAIPRFIDVDPATWTVDCAILEEEFRYAARRGRLPKALIAADLYGNPANIPRIAEICAEYRVPVVADCASSLGSYFASRHAGHSSLIAAVSFNSNKIVSTGGGGVLLTNDGGIASLARKLRAQARERFIFYDHRAIGYNYQISPFAASLGLTQLDDLDQRVSKRRKIFQRYVERLGSIPGIVFQKEAELGRSNRWLTAISLSRYWKKVDVIMICDQLLKERIEVRPLWRPLHLQPVFRGAFASHVQVGESVAERGLCLPSSTTMTDSEQDYVIENIIRALEKNQ